MHAALYIWRQLEAAGRVPNEDDEIMEQLFQDHRTLVTDYRRDQGDMNADDDLGYAGKRGQWVGNDTFLASAAVVGEGVAAVRDAETHEFPSPAGVVASDLRLRWNGTHYDVDVAASVVPARRPAWIPTASGTLHLVFCIVHVDRRIYHSNPHSIIMFTLFDHRC